MEDNKKSTLRKQEQLVQEINDLEKKISEVKETLCLLEKEEKLDTINKNIQEIKKQEANCNIAHYERYYKTVNNRLNKRQEYYSKYSVLNEAYDNILRRYMVEYFTHVKHELPDTSGEDSLNLNLQIQKIINEVQRDIESLNMTIERNSITIKSLLKDFEDRTE